MIPPAKTSTLQNFLRIVLGILMAFTAVAHCTFARAEFQAQVPDWLPLSKDLIVILSGIAELSLGLGMLFWKQERIRTGIALAVFYLLIFPGNIAQYTHHISAFGMHSDKERLIRLFFQPVLIIWALWSTGVPDYLAHRNKR